MQTTSRPTWEHFKKRYSDFPELKLAVDLSRMTFDEAWLAEMQPGLSGAFRQMADLEQGAIANPDEKRMVGHYWLRNSALAPTPEIKQQIESTVEAVLSFANRIHEGSVKGATGAFTEFLLIGIGGSALGPQFLSQALTRPGRDLLQPHFFDNTDPDGMASVLARIGDRLGQTLCLVISKSGGTPETRNGMLVAKAAYENAGLDFAKHAVAVTGSGSALDKNAEGWLARFPMWDWVGGRTSETSAVGLLPAALQGFDVREFLAGAAACDEVTRRGEVWNNPAAQLALAWYSAVIVKGKPNMVVLPYKDRLELFSKYLQQLVMESLGKEFNLQGKPVHAGITVLGNKGSTDQHAYVQQLRDGTPNFFATFIDVRHDGGDKVEVEAGVTAGDYLAGFRLGTREALFEKGRESISLSVAELSPFTIGVLIALYERAVGLYASLIQVNAYHQPGVEAGKKAAAVVLDLQRSIIDHLKAHSGQRFTVEEIASAAGPQRTEWVFHLCEHLAANSRIDKQPGPDMFTARYSIS